MSGQVRPAEGPRATYRVQLRPGFGFADAAAITGYLADLGISHLYASPILQAAAGSEHGYDVVDPSSVSEELGGDAALGLLHDALEAAGLLVLLDIVPNHMSNADPRNRWWWDVLAHGRHSRYARFFDIDWEAPDPSLRGRVLVPVLGDHVGRVVARGEIWLEPGPGGAVLRYYDKVLPLAPGSAGDLPEEPEARRRTLAELGREATALDAILARQHYRLAYWRLASEQDNYRRFFDITTLVALRTELPEVFEAAHRRILEMASGGLLAGVRIDHVDGLRRPGEYLRRLRGAFGPASWIVVEKILGRDETLPADWPVDGSTGYEFAARVTGLLVDPRGEEALTRLLADVSGEAPPFAEVARRAKREIMATVLSADVARLTRLLAAVCGGLPEHRDHPLGAVRQTVVELITALPVYRTYTVPGGRASDADAAVVERAVREVACQRPDLDGALLGLLGDVLLGRVAGRDAEELAMRLPQTAGAVAAKGVEDTAFYRDHRLVALNEVGGDPGRFGVSPDEFHAQAALVQERWPRTLLATSTHDTKRSEDVRARLAVLSEIPQRWAAAVRRWLRICERHRRNGLPDAAAQYLLFQTMVGAHPLDADRAVAYMEKASREAKLQTSWLRPDPVYDAALAAFVRAVVADPELRADLETFVAPVVTWGRLNSLSMTALKLTSPGVPDIYQGTEVWDLSLVDPDNRRPVDYARRRLLLARAAAAAPEDALSDADSGLPKLLLVHRGLRLRRRRPEDFGAAGAYTPLRAAGDHAECVVAFTRGSPAGVVVVAPRLVTRLDGGWGDTWLTVPEGRWRDEITGEEVSGGAVPVAGLLRRFPVALLSASGGPAS